jgi:aryl-alcohol dehydrogenase-like predicted oxidoreductase
MAELRAAGKVRRIGVSNLNLDQLQTIEPVAHVEVLQPPLSMIDRRAQGDLLPWCREHGTGVIAYSPMQSGLLSGAFDRARVQALDETDWRRVAPDFNEPNLSHNLALVDRLRPIAAELSVSVAELAIAWVIDQPGVTGAIVGARGPGQVDGWIGAASVPLTDDVRAALAEAIAAGAVV